MAYCVLSMLSHSSISFGFIYFIFQKIRIFEYKTYFIYVDGRGYENIFSIVFTSLFLLGIRIWDNQSLNHTHARSTTPRRRNIIFIFIVLLWDYHSSSLLLLSWMTLLEFLRLIYIFKLLNLKPWQHIFGGIWLMWSFLQEIYLRRENCKSQYHKTMPGWHYASCFWIS